MRKLSICIAVAFLYGCSSPTVKPQVTEPMPIGLRIVQDAAVFQCTPAAVKYNERSTQLDLTCK